MYLNFLCSASTRPVGARCQSNSKSVEMVMAEGTAVLRRNRPGTKAKVNSISYIHLGFLQVLFPFIIYILM